MLPPFGLIQIDGEQFTYFGRVECGQHDAGKHAVRHPVRAERDYPGGARASATVFPLNRFKPTYPWPVIPYHQCE